MKVRNLGYGIIAMELNVSAGERIESKKSRTGHYCYVFNWGKLTREFTQQKDLKIMSSTHTGHSYIINEKENIAYPLMKCDGFECVEELNQGKSCILNGIPLDELKSREKEYKWIIYEGGNHEI